MNILIFEWASFGNEDIKKILLKMGHNVYLTRKKYKTFSYDEELTKELIEEVEEFSKDTPIDLIFTTNYFESVAELAHLKNIKYISWCYDSPVELGTLERLKYETNFVFLFDKYEADEYAELGFENVHYLPLAVNINRYDEIYLNKTNEEIFNCDISFVGQLYESDLPKSMETLSDYSKGYIKSLIDSQSVIYDKNILREVINKNFMEYIQNPEFNKEINRARKSTAIPDQELLDKEPSDKIPEPQRLILKMQQLVTNRERMTLIALLSRHFDFKLYSVDSEKYEILNNAKHCGTIDSDYGAMLVYKASKINLNISVRNIEHAIPLRCLDIMGCGGFLMTNYQEGLKEHFADGRDLVIYSDPEDALEKAKFYLNEKNELLRQKIAKNGYKKVRRFYNYPDKFREMFKIAGIDV